jgi:hypothetical protein
MKAFSALVPEQVPTPMVANDIRDGSTMVQVRHREGTRQQTSAGDMGSTKCGVVFCEIMCKTHGSNPGRATSSRKTKEGAVASRKGCDSSLVALCDERRVDNEKVLKWNFPPAWDSRPRLSTHNMLGTNACHALPGQRPHEDKVVTLHSSFGAGTTYLRIILRLNRLDHRQDQLNDGRLGFPKVFKIAYLCCAYSILARVTRLAGISKHRYPHRRALSIVTISSEISDKSCC